jgi:hypothetical protein
LKIGAQIENSLVESDLGLFEGSWRSKQTDCERVCKEETYNRWYRRRYKPSSKAQQRRVVNFLQCYVMDCRGDDSFDESKHGAYVKNLDAMVLSNCHSRLLVRSPIEKG